VFLGVGFETTSPASAVAVLEAKRRELDNFSILCCHKLIPPAMKVLLESGDVKIDGFLCPGHVSTILGSSDYEFIPKEFGIPCVIAGFEPLDILKGIRMLVTQHDVEEPAVEIQYRRSVKPAGNPKAKKILHEILEPADAVWRGIGTIPDSGLELKAAFEDFDARKIVDTTGIESVEPEGCRCGEILRGMILPPDCALFGVRCTQENPVGPCMVSSEGTCSAYYSFDERT
jgi:hydrogenase expression/formation protein HypD